MAAIDDLTALLGSLPNASLVTEAMKTTALQGARVPDSFGLWPGEEGYEPTFDVYFAAVNLLGFLQAQPIVKAVSSEGTSVTIDSPNWPGLEQYYRSQSRILSGGQGAVLQPVRIPQGRHVKRTDMSDREIDGRRTSYGDVNTSA